MSIMDSLYKDEKNDKPTSQTSMILGNEVNDLKELQSIPKQVNENDVLNLARDVGSAEANNELLKLWSESSLNAQNLALSSLDLRINHARQSLKNQQTYTRKISQHKKDLSSHKLQNQVVQSNFDGYQSALNKATETIAL